MRDTFLSWALVNAFFALLFYAVIAFIFWQVTPGDWPAEGRAILGIGVFLMIGWSTLVTVGNRRAE